MNRTGRIKMAAIRLGGDHDAPALRLGHVIADGFGHGVQGQGPVGQSLNEFQAGHLFLPFGADRSIGFAGKVMLHRSTPRFNCTAIIATRSGALPDF